MKLLFIPSQFLNSSLRFSRYIIPACIVSAMIVIFAIVFIAVRGINLGLDFTGGVVIEVSADQQYSLSKKDITNAIEHVIYGPYSIQQIEDKNSVVIRIQSDDTPTINTVDYINAPSNSVPPNNTSNETSSIGQVEQITLALKNMNSNIEISRITTIGPRISDSLMSKSITSIMLSFLVVSLYIWFRFEWNFAVAALLALMHDIILTIFIFSILNVEFTLTIVAALMTVIGYSLNDTIVIADRIREEIIKQKTMNMRLVIDTAVNGVLGRTLRTSISTIIALCALIYFGGDDLRDFSFTLIWGVAVGTYSSIFVAGALVIFFPPSEDSYIKNNDDDDSKIVV